MSTLSSLLFFVRGFLRGDGGFFSLIAWISVVGLALGVAVLIIVTSVMNGFEKELQTRVLGVIPHGTITFKEPLKEWEGVLKVVNADPDVLGSAPSVTGQGLLLIEGESRGVVIKGVHPKYESTVSILPDFMVSGSFDALTAGGYGAVLGTAFAERFGLTVGQQVTVVLPSISATVGGVHPRVRRLRIVGLFELGTEIDSQAVFVHYQDAGNMFRNAGVSEIVLRTNDIFAASDITLRVGKVLAELRFRPANYFDWRATHGTLYQAIQLEQRLIALMLLSLILVAAFNVLATLVMKVHNHRNSIAVMKTMGASNAFLLVVFICQGFTIGLIGAGAGLFLGLSITYIIEPAFIWVGNVFELHLLDAYFLNYLPTHVLWDEVIYTLLAALLLSGLAGVYPALMAVRTDPSTILRQS